MVGIPCGGLVRLVEFFNKIGVAAKLPKEIPFPLHSPNAIPPAHTLMAFVCSVAPVPNGPPILTG
jgi:hypothetical protein